MSGEAPREAPSFALAVHGGAGPRGREGEDAREAARRDALRESLEAGGARLREGAPALDAVCVAVRVLEDCPELNAGRGSVLAADGACEMDAAVCRGTDLAAGAVACVRRVRNPVDAARALLDGSPHVLLAGEGADRFAEEAGLATAAPEHFATPERRAQLERVRGRGGLALDSDAGGGTVGAVARDARGGLAAATSTGGLVNKRPGRVSDSAVVGAGTWADDASCAVSATGHGERFLRCAFAHEVHARVRLASQPLGVACERALERVVALGGHGGCIAVDRRGRLALPFRAEAMLRGHLDAEGRPRVALGPDEP